MCSVFVFYSVEGNQTLTETEVTSYDPKTAACSPFLSDTNLGLAYNLDGGSTYAGFVSDEECHPS